MDGTSPPGQSSPKPILRRPTLRRGSTDYFAAPASPNRRVSEPVGLAERRDVGTMRVPLPARPPLAPQRRSTQRSVAFSPASESIEMVPQGSQDSRLPTYPLLRTPEEPHASLFGYRTRFRPLWLLGMGNSGLALFSMGEVLIQRAVWPVSQYEGLKPNGPTVLPGGTPGHGRAFGGPTGSIIAGSIFMAMGVGAAIGSSLLFLQDGRRLNRAQNPQAPNYRRTHGYFAAHQTAIAILVAHKFLIEAYRDNLPASVAWATALPGGAAQALFAVTQAQSFSSSEVANGKMPLKNRGLITAIARASVATYIFLGAYVATPNASAYGREALRLIAAVATNASFAMPLTTARLGGPSSDVSIGPIRYRGDWSAMQTFCAYALARLAGTISSFWLSRSRWPAAPIGHQQPAPINETFRNLPPPLPSLAPDYDETAAAAILMTISFGASLYAFLQFHRDAVPPLMLARLQLAAATSSVLLGLLFRSLQEYSKGHADFRMTWVATIPGFTAQALAFYSIPEMMARSESTVGNIPIPHRYRVIEACRFFGGLGWYLWAGQNQIAGFPPVARQITIWAATSATILGFALPNADTMRAARGATPHLELRNPFEN